MSKLHRKAIFDWVNKHLPGIWNQPGKIQSFDDALDTAEGITPAPAPKPAPPAAKKTDFDIAVIEHLEFEEGRRSKAYRDHLGFWTIGIGRLIDARKGGRITPAEEAILTANVPSRVGRPWREWELTDIEIDMLLLNDVARFVKAMQNWPAWQRVQGDVARMVALTSMCFQLGPAGLRSFTNSLRLIERGEFERAANNVLLSLWAKQTPARARRISAMIRTGKLK